MAEERLKGKSVSVKSVLEEFKEGDDSNYKRLLLQLGNNQLESDILLNLLNQLQCNAFILTGQFESLVVAILKIEWMHRDEDIQRAYMSLIINIVSAQPTYLHHILQTMVIKFSPDKLLKYFPGSGDMSATLTDANSWLEICYATIHSTIQSLRAIVPSLPVHLLKALQNHFPPISSPHETQAAYVKNFFHVTRYFPELRQDILEVVVNRITELDVHCPKSDIWILNDDNGDSEHDDMEMEGMQFDMDDVNSRTCAEERVKEPVPLTERGPELTDIAMSLDSLMNTLLTYCQDTCHKNGNVDVEESKALLVQLFHVFGKIVLPTHSSNHVQYCIFYVSSFRKNYGDAFLNYLWKKFVDPNVASMIRQSASSYMASFLSRANYISLGIITASLELMGKWIHSYIDNQELSTRVKQNMDIHGPFYTLCQAMFYIIVYHYKGLLGSEKGNKFVMSLNLDRIISCKLNPLSFCLPSIVNIFAAITRKYQVVFCYTIIERNARYIGITSDSSSRCQQDVNNPLDTFFPFDPYLLPKSGKFVHPLYKQWDGSDHQQNDSQMKHPEEEEDEIYEAHLQEVPLGLMASSVSAISPGFMSP